MGMFDYTALTAEGKLMMGRLEAAGSDEAADRLSGMGLTVQSLQKSAARAPARIGRDEFLMFNQQLASITRSGLPLERGLRELAAEVESGPMKRLLEEVAAELEAGASIDQVFEKRSSSVPPLYSQILRAGIASGRLSEMLTSLNRHLEISGQTRRIVLEAMTYPVMVLVLVVGLVTFLFQVLVPRFGPIFEAMGAPLPDLTQAVLFMAQHAGVFRALRRRWWRRGSRSWRRWAAGLPAGGRGSDGCSPCRSSVESVARECSRGWPTPWPRWWCPAAIFPRPCAWRLLLRQRAYARRVRRGGHAPGAGRVPGQRRVRRF